MTTAEERKFKVLPLYMDLQAKNLFGTERNVMFTEDLLEKYFNYEKGHLRGCKITNSVVITSELLKGKKIEMDIRIELPSKDIINLEFYSRYDDMSEIKSFIYITKVFGNHLKTGEYYDNIKKIKQINFIYDDNVRNDDRVIKRYAVINRDDPFDYILKNNFEIDIVNLVIKEDRAYNGINKGLADWIKFIGASTYEEMQKISRNKPILMEALKEMERFSNNEEVQDLFTREMLDKSRENYAKKKGQEEGIKTGEENILLSLKKIVAVDTSKEKEDILKKNPILREILEEMEKLKEKEVQDLFTKEMLDKSRENYAKKKGQEEGFKEGKEKGIELGAKNKSIEIAKKMLLKGISMEEIQKFTDLSIKEIEKISTDC